MKVRIALIIVYFVSIFAAPIRAAAAPAPGNGINFLAIDNYITAQMAKHGLQGIALAITRNDQISYLKGYGTAGWGRPLTPQTPMYIGSQSKSFTALAIAQLIEQGKVRLDAPVREYIPWFSVADADASQKITVNHLAHHISGLSEAGYTAIVSDNATLEEAIRSLSIATLTAPIGTKFQYFNMGYAVLMQVIENVSGEKYDEYIRQHIFGPLDMGMSFTDPVPARAAGLSQGYSRLFGFTVPWPQPHVANQLGDGYLISSAEDLAHYAIAMNNQAVYQGNRLLSADSMELMFSPIQGYGMGWFVQPGRINHGGANETFKTYVNLYPDRQLGIVLLINQGYMIDHYISAEQVFKGVEDIALGTTPPAVSDGMSVRMIGWGLLIVVLGLCVLHFRNFSQLRSWTRRARQMTPGRRAVDIIISFAIPTLILLVVYSQAKGFFGYRLNLSYQIWVMAKMLPDITILLVVGTIPDYIQGLISFSG